MLLKFILRSLKKRPFLNLIKIIGLTLGLSGILLIVLFLKNELSYDRYNTKAGRIYRFTITSPKIFNNQHFARIKNWRQVPYLAEHFPEIESYVRLDPIKGGVMQYNNKHYAINEAFECDSTFFKIFDAYLLQGNKKTILDAPASMVISESFAKKVFGDSDPVGKVISLPEGQYYAEKTDFTVKGVMKDFPRTSHFHPDLITTPAKKNKEWVAYTYLLLKEHSNPKKITSGYTQFLSELRNEPPDKIETKAHLQKLTDIHLYSNKLREIEPNGNMTNMYVLALAALILLIISMSNYASLNLGMMGFSNKFMIMNRILGSTQRMNFKYFIIESLFMVVISVTVAIFIVIPANIFIKTHFNLDLLKGNILLTAFVITIFSLLGIFSGLQPVLKQKLNSIKLNENLLIPNKVVATKGIIITQYAFAMLLLIAVIVITRQTRFVLNNSMGNQQDNIVCFERVHSDVQQKFETFKSELLKHNSIESVSAMLEPPGGETNDMFEFEIEGKKPEPKKNNNLIDVFPCDYSFAKLFHLNFLGGGNFSEKNKDVDGFGEYIINESAMYFMGYTNANSIVGQKFKLVSPVPGVELPEGKIIGVVSDFHLTSLKKKVEPLVLFKRENMWLLNFAVSYKPQVKETALADMKKVWTVIFPEYPFNYERVNSMYRKVYKAELLQSNLLSIFTFISIFISAMGLLGMSLLLSQQRIKEIGIRKVNGATIFEVMTMLNKDFIKWVVIAFVIAIPFAYYAMNKWLENYAYRIDLSWWIFAFAGITALGVAVLTISWQSWKAAKRNPVEALRNE